MKDILINTEYIKLDQFLKWVNLVSSGAEAKMLITDGQVIVNDEVELRRGKKLRKNDIIKVGGKVFVVR